MMEGNHGPIGLMDTAMAVFTPNVLWATYKFNDVFGMRGEGTSSATPQMAALYYAKCHKQLDALPEGWMNVEAIRHALFSSAKKDVFQDADTNKLFFRNGILQDMAAMDIAIPETSYFKLNIKQKKDKVFLPFIRMIFRMRLAAADSRSQGEYNMMEAELMQLSVRIKELHDLIDDDQDFIITGLSPEKRKVFAEIVRDSPLASKALRNKMEAYLRKIQ